MSTRRTGHTCRAGSLDAPAIRSLADGWGVAARSRTASMRTRARHSHTQRHTPLKPFGRSAPQTDRTRADRRRLASRRHHRRQPATRQKATGNNPQPPHVHSNWGTPAPSRVAAAPAATPARHPSPRPIAPASAALRSAKPVAPNSLLLSRDPSLLLAPDSLRSPDSDLPTPSLPLVASTPILSLRSTGTASSSSAATPHDVQHTSRAAAAAIPSRITLSIGRRRRPAPPHRLFQIHSARPLSPLEPQPPSPPSPPSPHPSVHLSLSLSAAPNAVSLPPLRAQRASLSASGARGPWPCV